MDSEHSQPKMKLGDMHPEHQISRFAYWDSPTIKAMTYQPGKAVWLPKLTRKMFSASSGSLGKLPLELTDKILNRVDLKSLLNLARVSTGMMAIVESHRPFQLIQQHVSGHLVLLHMTGVLGMHTAARLAETLRNQKCVACGNFAAFLFHPTCDRCCYRCLRHNQSLRMISTTAAIQFFRLPTHQVERLPQLRKLKYIEYPDPHPGTTTKYSECKFVSVAMVLQIAMDLVGIKPSEGKRRVNTTTIDSSFAGAELYPDMSLVPIDPRPDSLAEYGSADVDAESAERYYGLAGVHFPVLHTKGSLDEVQHGLWCKGCKTFSGVHNYGFMGTNDICGRGEFSRQGFLEHLKTCKPVLCAASITFEEQIKLHKAYCYACEEYTGATTCWRFVPI